MAMQPLTVLKFGGSVLGTARDYAAAVADVKRHLQRGERVLAVVSALKGATDSLLADARDFGPAPEPAATEVHIQLIERGKELLAVRFGDPAPAKPHENAVAYLVRPKPRRYGVHDRGTHGLKDRVCVIRLLVRKTPRGCDGCVDDDGRHQRRP